MTEVTTGLVKSQAKATRAALQLCAFAIGAIASRIFHVRSLSTIGKSNSERRAPKQKTELQDFQKVTCAYPFRGKSPLEKNPGQILYFWGVSQEPRSLYFQDPTKITEEGCHVTNC